MLRLLIIPIVLLALLGGAMFWSGGPAERKADFTFVSRDEVRSLDPNGMSWVQDFRIAFGLFEGLYRLDPQTLEAIPGTADQIDISPDKTLYTFHIRQTARWSNGDPVQAGDFVFAWRRMLEEPADYTYLLYYIKGAREYQEAFNKAKGTHDFGPCNFENVQIKPLDARTLQVKLIQPVAPFPDICAMPPFFPLNEKSMEHFIDKRVLEESAGHIRRFDKNFTRAPYLVSNGPYTLQSWAYKRRMRLAASPYYWDREHVESQIVDQVIAEDDQWAYAMYNSGGADLVTDFTGDIAAELYARRRPDMHVFPAFGTYFYSFNCQPKFNDGRPNPFFDKRVRQAFTRVIDKRVIVDTITRLGELPTTTYIPAGSFKGYHTPAGLAFDIEVGKKLLADAGYPGGAGFPAITLLFNDASPHSTIAENIRRQWHDALGIDVKLEGIEVKTFGERHRNKDYAIARASWFGDYIDPSTFTDKYKPESENNESGWINPEYDAMCKRADVEIDPAKRLRYYEEAETLLLDEAPILPLYTYVGCYVFSDKVKGIPLNRRVMHVMSSVKVAH